MAVKVSKPYCFIEGRTFHDGGVDIENNVYFLQRIRNRAECSIKYVMEILSTVLLEGQYIHLTWLINQSTGIYNFLCLALRMKLFSSNPLKLIKSKSTSKRCEHTTYLYVNIYLYITLF